MEISKLDVSIHNALFNQLFDVYYCYKVAKDIWAAMKNNHILEPKNMLYGILEKFQMTKDKDVSSQIHDYHLLINDLANEDLKLLEPFVARYLIKTFPNS